MSLWISCVEKILTSGEYSIYLLGVPEITIHFEIGISRQCLEGCKNTGSFPWLLSLKCLKSSQSQKTAMNSIIQKCLAFIWPSLQTLRKMKVPIIWGSSFRIFWKKISWNSSMKMWLSHVNRPCWATCVQSLWRFQGSSIRYGRFKV